MPRKTMAYKIDPVTAGRLFAFLGAYKIVNDGNTPATEEIRKFMGFRSAAQVREYLFWLEDEGHIKIDPSKSRSILITGGLYRYTAHYKAAEVLQTTEMLRGGALGPSGGHR